MKIDGSCHCGAITYEAELDIEKVGICHCEDCQKLSASVYRTIAVVDAASFKVLSGQPKEYVKIAESGNRRAQGFCEASQGFCEACGSGLYATNADEDRPVYNLRVGTVNQRKRLVPKFELWRSAAMPWLPMLSFTKAHDRGAS